MPAFDDDPGGVGPVVSLAYRAIVDVLARFRKFKSVGAVFGLTSAQSAFVSGRFGELPMRIDDEFACDAGVE
jgi:hypothetical protein